MAWTREEREGILEELWPLVRDATKTVEVRLEAALGILEAYWNGSFEHFYGREGSERHPTYKQYGAGFLAHHIDRFPKELAPLLIRRFGTDPDLLAPGYTIWAPPGSRERKRMEENG
ncbi:hypothetical protein C8P63_10558 [Melghirimyces profundicolus]|uniref:Uncharacterized protein n=1 Tax=Melghirimyces profundicolus TaxID=1242148 RepID=A0A2T6C2E5_9BACL|nr:hypothetical protein [Melghirimyces profundicolus]PTX62463.1 hypothetical protein C8P63_10558 [Melghirimyces profundicolus]